MHDGIEGWAGYKVSDQVTTHNLFGGGVYVFNRNNPSDPRTENGFEVPVTGRPVASHRPDPSI